MFEPFKEPKYFKLIGKSSPTSVSVVLVDFCCSNLEVT